ncbi:hypothetical protein J6590_045922 [Homalodisca vitripennis]|nr:hypothetical protein J6590_045922 [Homalodisca vitripennis]
MAGTRPHSLRTLGIQGRVESFATGYTSSELSYSPWDGLKWQPEETEGACESWGWRASVILQEPQSLDTVWYRPGGSGKLSSEERGAGKGSVVPERREGSLALRLPGPNLQRAPWTWTVTQGRAELDVNKPAASETKEEMEAGP